MISKRRKTSTLRKKQSKNANGSRYNSSLRSSRKSLQKKQKKYSNRVRSINRINIGGQPVMEVEGAVLNFPNDAENMTAMAKFKSSYFRYDGENQKYHFITETQFKNRQSILSELKKNLDTLLTTNNTTITPENFNEYIINPINKHPAYSNCYFEPKNIYGKIIESSASEINCGFVIYPRIKDYVEVGFSIEELFIANIPGKITIKRALDSIFPLQKNDVNNDDIKGKRDALAIKIGNYLRNNGFTPYKLLEAGCWPYLMFKIGLTDEEIINAGFTIDDLISAGYKLDAIKQFYKRDFKIEELIENKNNSIDEIKKIFTAEYFKKLGYSKYAVRDLRYTIGELIAGGYTLTDLIDRDLAFSFRDDTANDFFAAGVKLKDLINRFKEIELANRESGKSELGYRFISILTSLKNIGYDLLSDEYNLSDIFESGTCPYNIIKKMFELYKKESADKVKMDKISKRLDELKKNCNKNSFTKVTDPECTYKPKN